MASLCLSEKVASLEEEKAEFISSIKKEVYKKQEEINSEMGDLKAAKSLLEFQLVEAKTVVEDKEETLKKYVTTIEDLRGKLFMRQMNI